MGPASSPGARPGANGVAEPSPFECFDRVLMLGQRAWTDSVPGQAG